MWTLAMILLGPFLFAHYFGIKGAIKWMFIFVIINVLLIGGFLFGLLHALMWEPSSYWKAFDADHWYPMTTTFIDSMDSDTPLAAGFMIPWYSLVDIYRAMWWVNTSHFCIPLIIPELMCLFILRNFFIIFTNGGGVRGTGVSQREIDFYKGGF